MRNIVNLNWQAYADTYPELYEDSTVERKPIPDIISFCEDLTLGMDKFTFQNREFLKQILLDDSEQITVLKSRQVGFTVLQAAVMAWHALKYPGIGIMYCSYNLKHMRYISKSLLRPFLKTHMELKKSEESIESYFLPNGSIITLISGSNAFAQAKGYKVDLLCVDECEDLPLEELPIILETMSASDKFHKVIMGGTGTAEGTEWEKVWKNTNQMEWDGSWKPTKQSNNNGYHVTQKMMPNWSQSKEDAKRSNPNYSPLRFATEVLGIFAIGIDVPLTLQTVKSCMYEGTWDESKDGLRIASLDLAGGGEADTILTISDFKDDTMHVKFSVSLQDKHGDILFSKIKPYLDQYNPDHICCDSGGNDHLKYLLQQNYQCNAYTFTLSHDPIKYTTNAISKTFFMQKVIERFKNRKIKIPNAEPWLTDHLTSQTSELKQPANGPSYIRFEKKPNHKDDFLMSLLFAECEYFSTIDENNPNRRRKFWGFTTD